MPQRSLWAEFKKGILEQNTLFIIVVGLCPSLAVTTSLPNAVAMGVAVSFVLVCSNALIALLRHAILEDVRIPCFVVIVGSFVTIVEILFKGLPVIPLEVNQSLGIFIPLIVVNCIILYRAESFAYSHGVLRSVLDGLGVGIGYSLAICLVAAVREVVGNGTIWTYPWLPGGLPYRYVPASIMIQAPGAFLVLGLLLAFFNWLKSARGAR